MTGKGRDIGTIDELRHQILAFRLSSHHLDRRLPAGSLLKVAGACGVQNTPPGSAELSFLARLEGLAPGDIDKAVEERRTLAQAWSLRAAPHLFPAADLDIFTLALLPWDEASLRFFVRGVSDHLDKAGMSAARLLELTSEMVGIALNGRALVKEDLAIEVARLMEPMLTPEQVARWHEPDLFGWSGETMVRYALYLSSLRGRVIFGRREGSKALLVRPDEWLRTPSLRATPKEARAELVRRYLHCYGPSSPADLAAWAPDDTNNRVLLVLPLQTWAAVTAGDNWEIVVVAYDNDTTGGTDANLIPITAGEIRENGTAVVPTGDPVVIDFSSGWIAAV
jgi:hypothetical protein